MTRPVIFCSMAIILFAVSTFGAFPQGPSSDSPPPTTAVPASQGSSKVWTNDNIALASSGIDDSRPTAGANTIPESRPKLTNAKGRNAKWYRDQIMALESRIPPIDAQITELQSALDGKAAGDGKTSQRPRYAKIDQWPAELKDLQTRRQTIIDKIDVLRDEARRNGVPANTLP